MPGALDDLTRLEQRAEQLAGQQGAICEQLTQLQTLQVHVGELRARRDRLKAEQATRGAKVKPRTEENNPFFCEKLL